jgi:hypothetical protein
MKTWLSRVAVLTLIASAMLSGPAHAAKVTVRDSRGDVYVTKPEFDFERLGETRPNVDIVRASVSHASRKVRVRVEYVDLVRDEDIRVAGLSLKTSKRARYLLQWAAFERRNRGEVYLVRAPKFKDVRCHGMKFAPDYDANMLAIDIPRKCVGRPHWLQFHAEALSFSRAGAGEQIYADAAGAERYPALGWSKRVGRN